MAGGQVRCGRCTQVFDAKATLTDVLPAQARARADDAGAAPAQAPAREAAGADGDPAAKRGAGTDADAARTSEPAAGPARDEDGVVFLPAEWLVEESPQARKRSTLWAAGAAAAALLIAAQVVHHFRESLVRDAAVGGLVERAYAALGIEVVPRWDPDSYRIRDWAATARDGANGQSSLLIRAEIENRSADALPQPHIYLGLKDRWDSLVAERVFEPGEYLESARANGTLNPGATTIAELEVVDPGPDAYGFELDVCVRTGSAGVRCANQDVFR